MIEFKTSTSANNGSGSTDLTGTKPAGTVDGDLLVAVIGIYGDRTVSAVPSGWALAASETSGSTGEPRGYIYYKVASSEGASWEWTISSSVRATIVVKRFDGQAASSPFDKGSGALVTGDSTAVYTNGITPAQIGSMFVFAVIGRGVSSDSFPTIDPSAYSMVNDNPSFINEVTQATGDSPHLAMGVVNAVRLEATATGNFSATLQGTSTDSAAVVAIFKTVNRNASGTAALHSASPTFLNNTSVQVTGNGTSALHLVEPEFFSQSGRVETPAVWTPEVKTATTWTPEIK